MKKSIEFILAQSEKWIYFMCLPDLKVVVCIRCVNSLLFYFASTLQFK